MKPNSQFEKYLQHPGQDEGTKAHTEFDITLVC